MFLVPMGDLEWGAVGVGYYTWKSLLLRNMVGGGLFVGAVFWYLYPAGRGMLARVLRWGLCHSGSEWSNGKVRGLEGNIIIGVSSGREGEANGDELKIATLSRGEKMNGDNLPHSGSPL
jgi:hypothetical protein